MIYAIYKLFVQFWQFLHNFRDANNDLCLEHEGIVNMSSCLLNTNARYIFETYSGIGEYTPPCMHVIY